MNNLFHIVIPFFNVEKWISRCIQSIKEQNYQNYKAVLVNDMSTDNTVSAIKSEIKDNDKFSLIHTSKNAGALNSTICGVNYAKPNDNDVIIVLDGDDWFANKNSLDIVNNAYTTTKCLMTYGSYTEYPRRILRRRGRFAKQLPSNIIQEKKFRQYKWVTSHLRTFKYVLWRNIKREDLLDSTGKIYAMAGELPVMFPMLEMAEERSHFIKDIIHVYNRSNPLSEDKVNHDLALAIEAEIRNKAVYPRLIIEDLE